MSEALFRPFFEATENVFQLMLALDGIHNEPASELPDASDATAVSVKISGDLEGRVIYRFPRLTSLHMVNIMSGMEVEEVDDFVTSAVSEIANIISGNVMTLLTDQNLSCDILPPELVDGSGPGEYREVAESRICTSAGDIYLSILLNPAKVVPA